MCHSACFMDFSKMKEILLKPIGQPAQTLLGLPLAEVNDQLPLPLEADQSVQEGD